MKHFVLLFLLLNCVLINCIQDQTQAQTRKLVLQRKSKSQIKAKTQTQSTTEQITPMEGWLSVSSPEFENESKFPQIPANNNYVALKVTEDTAFVEESMQEEFGNQGLGTFRTNNQFVEGGDIPSATSFYFRLTETNLYYTSTDTDMIVLGAINIQNIVDTAQGTAGEFCFNVQDNEDEFWDLCAQSEEEKQSWIDAVQAALGVLNNQDEGEEEDTVVQIKQTVNQPIILIPLPSPFCNYQFNYKENGDDWNCKCEEGYSQSPIAIPFSPLGCPNAPQMTGPNQVKPVEKSAIFKFLKVETDLLHLVYKDNKIVLQCGELGDSDDDEECQNFKFATLIDLEYVEYHAKEIHFHTPAEHTIAEEVFAMEIQVIFHSVTDGDFKKKAVLSFMARQEPGGKNVFMDQINDLNLPNIDDTDVKLDLIGGADSISVQDLFLNDPEDVFRGFFSYYNYQGSLTHPPCEEFVNWYIVSPPISIGFTLNQMFKDPIFTVPKTQECKEIPRQPKNPNGNNRNIQETNDRDIFFFDLQSNTCYPQIQRKIQPPIGHFEKITRPATTFLYVPNQKPSGIPGAFVIPKEEAEELSDDFD